MATITVPRNVRESGKVRVRETPHYIQGRIEDARRRGLQVIVLTELTDTHQRVANKRELRIKWSLIQAIE